jgi:predicted  nucleic acid-binding Zn-ribbon protein
LKQRVGILRGDADEARQDAEKRSDAFSMLNEEYQQNKEKWKRIQTRLVADVESTTEENGRLKKVVDSLNPEMKKLKQEQDVAIQRT